MSLKRKNIINPYRPNMKVPDMSFSVSEKNKLLLEKLKKLKEAKRFF